jgi:hypothetical protein
VVLQKRPQVPTAVTDGSGQYRLDNLTAGTYSVTYTLPGFSMVKREGVQLQTGVTLTLNADMRVGGLQETITVTGETPVVDVQNSKRVQRVLSDEVLKALPASRGYGNLLATVSGVQANGIQSGGINPTMVFFTSRGGRSNEGTVQIDGMNVGSAFNGGGVSGYGYDTANAQEVQSCGHLAFRTRRRSSRTGTPASLWAARSSGIESGSTAWPVPAASTPTSPDGSET